MITYAKKELTAWVALVFTTLTFVIDFEVVKNSFRAKQIVIAYLAETSDGRCPVAAFEILNKTSKTLFDVRLVIQEGWITNHGDDKLLVFTFEEAFISPGETTPIRRKPKLDVHTELSGARFVIPRLLPGEYVQRLVLRSVDTNMDKAHAKMADDPVQRVLPTTSYATFENGKLEMRKTGFCLGGS